MVPSKPRESLIYVQFLVQVLPYTFVMREGKVSKDTPSMAKNKIRRSLLAILDPHPSDSEVEELWHFFESQCAYCGITIARGSRTGHLDHVIASTLGGGNGIHNSVLSCAHCNGDEKREEDWRIFLRRKAESAQVSAVRAERIVVWLSGAPAARLSPEAEQLAHAIVAEAIAHYEGAVAQVRALRHVGA